MTGRSRRTLTNSAGGALALTGGGSGGRASGGGGGGGGGGDASVTYSDRSVSSWGGGAQQEPTNQSREQLWSWTGRRGESQLHGDTHTHRMKVSLAHMTGEEAPMWSACADSTSDQINSNM